MKLVLAKQDFRNSDAWSEVCDTLGLPDNTTQVEIAASATKVRTVEHPSGLCEDDDASASQRQRAMGQRDCRR